MRTKRKSYEQDMEAGLWGQPVDHVRKKSSWMKGFTLSPRKTDMDMIQSERIQSVNNFKSRLIKQGFKI